MVLRKGRRWHSTSWQSAWNSVLPTTIHPKCDVNCCLCQRRSFSNLPPLSLYWVKMSPCFRKENLPLLDAFLSVLNKLKPLLTWIKSGFIECKINHTAISQTRHLSVLAHTSFHSIKKQKVSQTIHQWIIPNANVFCCDVCFKCLKRPENKHLVSGFQ